VTRESSKVCDGGGEPLGALGDWGIDDPESYGHVSAAWKGRAFTLDPTCPSWFRACLFIFGTALAILAADAACFGAGVRAFITHYSSWDGRLRGRIGRWMAPRGTNPAGAFSGRKGGLDSYMRFPIDSSGVGCGLSSPGARVLPLGSFHASAFTRYSPAHSPSLFRTIRFHAGDTKQDSLSLLPTYAGLRTGPPGRDFPGKRLHELPHH